MEYSEIGPIEWGTVIAHQPYGLEVNLEKSGRTGIVNRGQVHRFPIYFNEEYSGNKTKSASGASF